MSWFVHSDGRARPRPRHQQGPPTPTPARPFVSSFKNFLPRAKTLLLSQSTLEDLYLACAKVIIFFFVGKLLEDIQLGTNFGR